MAKGLMNENDSHYHNAPQILENAPIASKSWLEP